MESSKLKFNPDKPDVIIIGSKQRNTVINHFSTKLLGSDIFTQDTVHNIGVVFERDFNFRQHISQVCKSFFYHRLSPSNSASLIYIYTAKTISMALIGSRLDYCNSLQNDIGKIDLAKLQRVQNCLARVVLGAPRFSPPLPLLRQRNGFLLLIELILSCPLLHTVLYLHNNHPTLLVSCSFHISLGRSAHQFHNLVCLKQNLTWANVLSLSLLLGSGLNAPSL